MKKKQIDEQDIIILNILMQNAELSNKRLSEIIDLSEGPTLVKFRIYGKRGSYDPMPLRSIISCSGTENTF